MKTGFFDLPDRSGGPRGPPKTSRRTVFFGGPRNFWGVRTFLSSTERFWTPQELAAARFCEKTSFFCQKLERVCWTGRAGGARGTQKSTGPQNLKIGGPPKKYLFWSFFRGSCRGKIQAPFLGGPKKRCCSFLPKSRFTVTILLSSSGEFLRANF